MKLSLKKSYKKLFEKGLLLGTVFLLFACSQGGGGGAAGPLTGAGVGSGLGLPGGGPGGSAAPDTTEVTPYAGPDPQGQKYNVKIYSMTASAECAPDVTGYKLQMKGNVQIINKPGWMDCPGDSCNGRALAIIDGHNYMIVHTASTAVFGVGQGGSDGFSSGPGRGLLFYFFPSESGEIPADLEFDKMLNCPSPSASTCLPGTWFFAGTSTSPNYCCGIQCAD